MPTTQSVSEFVQQELGFKLESIGNDNRHSASLIKASEKLGSDLGNVIYKAIVRENGNTKLTGQPINATQLRALRKLAAQTRQERSCAGPNQLNISNLEGSTKRYEQLLRAEVIKNFPNGIINKQPRIAAQWNTEDTPRHTLIKRSEEIYEILTWMTSEEIERLQARFPNTEGLFSITSEKERTRPWGSENLVEHKITLGSGAFGSARLARRVSDDEYMVIKKVHEQDFGPKPSPTPTLRGVNDGSLSGVSRVYDSFYAHSTRKGGETHRTPSVYTLSELGAVDTFKFISILSVYAYALNPENRSEPLATHLIEAIFGDTSDELQAFKKLTRLTTNPCTNAELVRRFKNTFALQMLYAVKQMHSKDKAHNDIKPDNFILAYGSDGLLRVKLIDFDLSASVKQTVGQARDIYAKVFSAPQVSSNEVNNQADRNDAFSLGCSLRLLNGEPLEALVVQRLMLKGEIRNQYNLKIKPVEDRRPIESRFAVLPDIATLSDVISLLSHPHAGKRYTVQQAIDCPLFANSSNLLSPQEFSAMAEKLIRQGRMIPRETLEKLGPLQQIARAINADDPSHASKPFGPMASALSEQDRKLVVNRYIEQHGAQKLSTEMQQVKQMVKTENRTALVRRGLRQLSISHQLKSKAEKEAGYTYKTPKK